jgi:cytochrome c oxidase subunit III
MFYAVYFFTTGLHSLHVLVGVGLLGWLMQGTLRGKSGSRHITRIECVGLYWHFVDMVWVFLYPMFYLVS